MDALITILPGDGIGPEVAAAGRAVLETVAQTYGHNFEFSEQLIGGAALDAGQPPLPDDAIASCRESQAVVLGAVGGPKWSDPNAPVRPEQGLLQLRGELQVFANVRPVQILPELAGASPLRRELLEGVDIVVIRELTGGIYFGEKSRDAQTATDLCVYHDYEVQRIVRVAAKMARDRRGRLCSVDKANVLETSRLWRDVTTHVMAEEFSDVALEHILVDAAAMHLISRPADFDVIVTENMFGDILTDEARCSPARWACCHLHPSATAAPGFYEPIHGSAPDIAGQGIANPCGMIGSVAMLLRHSLSLPEEADHVDRAIREVIANGLRTADIATPNDTPVSTQKMTEAITATLR